YAASAESHPGAAVLREARVGDVEGRENLDATDQRRLRRLRKAGTLREESVDSISDLDDVVERLYVDVRRGQLDAAPADLVHHAGSVLLIGRRGRGGRRPSRAVAGERSRAGLGPERALG